jgi:hypothetical protein
MFLNMDLLESRKVFVETLPDAITHNYERAIFYIRLHIAEIDFLNGNVEQAEDMLRIVEGIAENYRDKLYSGRIYVLKSRIDAKKTLLLSAANFLEEAIGIFERLGRRRELAEAREELARLEAQMAKAAE